MSKRTSRVRSSFHRGITIVETMVSLAVLGVVLLLLGQMGVAAAGYRQRSEAQRQVAQDANNLAERLRALPIVELTADKIKSLQNPAEGNTAFTIHLGDDEPGAAKLQSKRISIRAKHRQLANIECELLIWRHAADDSAREK
jgi:type II secretory pathway pseudopilin PulG